MPINVNWSDLEIAFERNSPDQESFLDLENGDLLSIIEGEPDAAARRARVAAHPIASCGSIPASSREQYRWMERFVGSVSDERAARAAAHRHRRQGRVPPVQGRAAGVPGRARALVRLPVRAAALSHSDLARPHEDRGREPAALGPRRASRPSRWSCRAPTVPSEAPGEILRRQARDLLDEIPAAELPSALAFLEFLRDRGASSLLRSTLAERRRSPSLEDDDDDDDDRSGDRRPVTAGGTKRQALTVGAAGGQPTFGRRLLGGGARRAASRSSRRARRASVVARLGRRPAASRRRAPTDSR